ncbi:putative methyltransferase-domain-containing protein [Desarmillaria tabescens]|uniref:Methyltransferase-domain-containing protein n=1 Tax=Armillaria tabescens TaxID=1929756 RepID=A0AA39J059_ARMTA|nr:putative methyltransferase-domain-containing protein [Desarmillaria tabescens]KAK0432354.1 putative methyltransferase-domain-containing protein [Desarmillaria tabescens]
MSTEDPEDILSGSLQILYDYKPVTLTSAGSVFSYTSDNIPGNPITLRTPDTHPSNWSLHASSIWASSLFLVDHLQLLDLPESPVESFRVLELGAGAGLPGISMARKHPSIQVTVSDYPDEELIRTLEGNIARNDVQGNCRAVAYAWGSDPSALIGEDGSDVVVAADTLWNPDLHVLFIRALQSVLKRSPTALVHLVAGLHTGRYTLQSFIMAAEKAGFAVLQATEMETGGSDTRPWCISRAEGEDEKERRRWVVWIILKWASPTK